MEKNEINRKNGEKREKWEKGGGNRKKGGE